jgi:hypothetical protein
MKQNVIKHENIIFIVNVIKFGYFIKSASGECKILSIIDPWLLKI